MEVCHRHVISPSQLTPKAWRLLMAMKVFCDLHDINFSLEEIFTVYSFKECNVDACRFQLHCKRNCLPLIPKIDDCSKTWKIHFFFVPFDSLGLSYDSRVSRICDGASECTI